MRIVGGTEKDFRGLSQIRGRRDPAPHSGLARELFASDLSAQRHGRLFHAHEQQEKELLRIGERLGLRGPQLDKLHREALDKQRRRVIRTSLGYLSRMTLTVIDGDFPRDVLARDNLTFERYSMPPPRNTPAQYDAKHFGPPPKQEGILLGSLEGDNMPQDAFDDSKVATAAQQPARTATAAQSATTGGVWFVLVLLVVAAAGLARLRRHSGVALLILGGLLACTAGQIGTAGTGEDREVALLLRQLDEPQRAESAAELLVARGQKVVPQLAELARRNQSLMRRGWAIVCLNEIGGKQADHELAGIHADNKLPVLVRTWAAAGRVPLVRTADELIAVANLVLEFPPLARPVGEQLVVILPTEKGEQSVQRLLSVLPEGSDSTADLIALALQAPALQSALARPIIARGAPSIAAAMLSADETNLRRQAAAYLAAMRDPAAAAAVLDALRFRREAKQVPWNGGPLFLPGLQWTRDDARQLVTHLIAWHLWCDLRSLRDQQRQIDNNLFNTQLTSAAGFQRPQRNRTVDWLTVWGEAVGRAPIEKMLAEQGADDDSKYAAVLELLK